MALANVSLINMKVTMTTTTKVPKAILPQPTFPSQMSQMSQMPTLVTHLLMPTLATHLLMPTLALADALPMLALADALPMLAFDSFDSFDWETLVGEVLLSALLLLLSSSLSC